VLTYAANSDTDSYQRTPQLDLQRMIEVSLVSLLQQATIFLGK
jgi:hypothetical protein